MDFPYRGFRGRFAPRGSEVSDELDACLRA